MSKPTNGLQQEDAPDLCADRRWLDLGNQSRIPAVVSSMRTLLALVCAAVVLAGCDSGPSAEATRTTVTTSPIVAQSGDVTVVDAVYECGPTDVPAISVTATSTEARSVVADLVVNGEEFGPSDPVDIGPEPSKIHLSVKLSQAAYEAEIGEVRVRAPREGGILATRPITLRLAYGGCG